jgi:hypothetical protein
MAAPFTLRTPAAHALYQELRARAEKSLLNRAKSKRAKASKDEGLFKQVHKTLDHLHSNPKHPGLHTHEYHSLSNPIDPRGKVFEACAQSKTPAAYRVFWCYGPGKGEITIIAITKHP